MIKYWLVNISFLCLRCACVCFHLRRTLVLALMLALVSLVKTRLRVLTPGLVAHNCRPGALLFRAKVGGSGKRFIFFTKKNA